MPLSPHTHNPPTIDILHQSGTFVTTHEPTLTPHHPQSMVYISLLLVLYPLLVLTMYPLLQYHAELFLFPKHSLCSVSSSFLPSNPWKPLLFFFHCLHSFAFSRMSYVIVENIQYVLFHIAFFHLLFAFMFPLCVFHGVITRFYLVRNNFPLFGYLF